MNKGQNNAPPLDPDMDGPRVFDSHPPRLLMAEACRRPLAPARLAEASGQKDGNARKTAAKMVEYGVLDELYEGKALSGYCLNDRWESAVRQARLKASKGRLKEGQMMFFVKRGSTTRLYRLIADRDQVDSRLSWMARLPYHPKFGLIVAVNPELNEDAVERLAGELEEAQVDHERLSLGRFAGSHELREFASSSLPGAFGNER